MEGKLKTMEKFLGTRKLKGESCIIRQFPEKKLFPMYSLT